MDCSLPGSSVHGLLRAIILEWVAIPFSRGSSHPGIEPTSLTSYALAGEFFTISATWESHFVPDAAATKSLSHVWLLVTPWTGAHQAPPSMGFSRQEYWSGVPSPSPYLCLHPPQLQYIPLLHASPSHSQPFSKKGQSGSTTLKVLGPLTTLDVPFSWTSSRGMPMRFQASTTWIGKMFWSVSFWNTMKWLY